jgi:hypothetical protein
MSDVTKLALLAVPALFAGCVLGGGAAPGDESAVSALDSICTRWGCGTNSPTIGDGVVFDELDSSMTQEDANGIKIQSAVLDDGSAVDLHVIGDLLTANRHGDPTRLLTDDELKRIIIKITARRDTGDLVFEMRIEDINKQILSYWAGPREEVPAYLVTARLVSPDTKQFEHVCHTTATPVTEPQWRDASYYAVMFSGDRYNPRTKTVVDAPADTTWFNLACAATAPAKMHLMRHTNAGAGAGRAFATTVAERRAMLKMFTADYCGDGNNSLPDGTMFTVDGQPLLYGDSRAWYTPPPGVPVFSIDPVGALSPPGTTMEALWTANGAACLTTPRRVSAVVCAKRNIPVCKPETIAHWSDRYHVISVNSP